MRRPFFSIIIPTLNEERYLPHLLADLATQTYQDFEVIVVDAESQDQTPLLVYDVRKKDKRFLTISCNKRNVSVQRNLGALATKGDHLLFFDADTRVSPAFLKDLHQQIRDRDFDACSTFSHSSNPEIKFVLFCMFANMTYLLTTAIRYPFCWGAMMYVKRSVFNKIKGFDPTIHFMEDSDLAQRIVQSGHSFRLLRHPKFIFSMRRYEKKGLVSYFRQMFQYYVAILIYHKSIPKEAYPMDGGVK